MDAEDRYDSLIQWTWMHAAQRWQFDTASWGLVKWQIKQESAFNPEAVSPAGARGLLQIMPATWGAGFEADAFNPEKNLAQGVEHLGLCWSIFKAEQGLERWKFALAAYDAGQEHIIRAQALAGQAGQPTDQWTVVATFLPQVTGDRAAETHDYVRTIMADYLSLDSTKGGRSI